VHDSIVFQIPMSERGALPAIKHALDVEVPYADPLVIGSKMAVSTKSWGDLVEFNEAKPDEWLEEEERRRRGGSDNEVLSKLAQSVHGVDEGQRITG